MTADPPLPPNTVFAVRNDRLGGRLGAILNGLRIARDSGADFRFFWPSHDGVSPELQHPEQLFTDDFMALRETRLSYGDLQNRCGAVEQLAHGCDARQFADLLQTTAVRCTEALRAVALPWEDPAVVSARVAATLDEIGFQPRVRAAMDHIRGQLGDVPLIAYHLRRGDIIDPGSRPSNVLWPTKYIPSVFYETHIARTLRNEPEARIVVFSDSDRERAAFVALSDRVIAADRLLDGQADTELQRDFLELYAMSRCRRIIAPGASNFSTVAAILGDSRIVPIVSDLTPGERNAALDDLTDRVARQPARFAGDADLGQNFPALLAHHDARGSGEVMRQILDQHWQRGFRPSYIHDLLAERHFRAGDAPAAVAVAHELGQRPILTDLANAPTHAWAGLAAWGAGDVATAAQQVQVAHYLHPVLPSARLAVALIGGAGGFPADGWYPYDPVVLRPLPPTHPWTALARLVADQRGDPAGTAQIVPFELDLRDWRAIQPRRLPGTFWNLHVQRRSLDFMRSAFRHQLDHPEIMSLIGQAEVRLGDQDTGAARLAAAAAASPDSALVAIRQARFWLATGDERALSEFARADDLAGGQICFRAERARALLQLGQAGQAQRLFAQLAERDHPLIEILLQTADALRRRQKTRELALRLAERAAALAPGALGPAQLRRRILIQLDRTDDAEAIERQFSDWNRRLGGYRSALPKPDATDGSVSG